MNGYELSKPFWDWAFENPEKISPNHCAIYFFAVEHCNRLGWKKKFGFPSQMTMDAIGIKKHSTYIRYFNDLVEWGFFELLQRSTNQYSANIICFGNAMPKNGKALGKATMTHGAKHTAKQKEYNKTNKHKTNKHETKVFSPPSELEFREHAYKTFCKSFSKDSWKADYKNLVALQFQAWDQSGWINGRTNKPILDWRSTLTRSLKYILNL